MSNDSEKFECLKRLAHLVQLVLEDKRASSRISKIAQTIISERQQEDRALDMNRQGREIIDSLILKVMSGEINFHLDNCRASVLLRYENEMNICSIMYDRPSDETQFTARNIKAELSNHDFYNTVALPLNQQDKEFFFNLWKEKLHMRDQALLSRFAQDSLKS